MDRKKALVIRCIFFGNDADSGTFSGELSRAFENGLILDFERKDLPENSECPRVEIPEWRITWYGIPGRRELAILSDFFLKSPGVFPEEPEMGTNLLLFVGKLCPFCPGVLRKILPLLSSEKISLEIVDGEACKNKAAAHDIRAVPTLMIAGDEKNFRWVGDVGMKELSSALLNRKPEDLGEESLKNILESGEAERLVAMMRETGEIYPSFYGLLFHEKWSVRLGAMVVAETLAEEGDVLGEKLLETLWEKKDGLGATILGDMVYLMGFGKPSLWKQRLRKLLSETEEGELKDAIEEALENLET